jgi:hypothetical protein
MSGLAESLGQISILQGFYLDFTAGVQHYRVCVVFCAIILTLSLYVANRLRRMGDRCSICLDAKRRACRM